MSTCNQAQMPPAGIFTHFGNGDCVSKVAKYPPRSVTDLNQRGGREC